MRISVGARPGRPVLWVFSKDALDREAVITKIMQETVFGTNTRGSAEYRRAMTGVLLKRYFEEQL